MTEDRPDNEDSAGKPRLWVVSELYYPEETSTGYYLTRIAEGLTEKFDVKAISGQPNYSARGTKAARRETRHDVEIFRVRSTTLDKNVIVFRLVNMISLGISVFLEGLRRFRGGDRVLVVTTPPTMPFVVAVSAMLRGAVYYLLIHDNYPEILVAAGKTEASSAFARIMGRMNRWLYKSTAKIIVVGRDMSELIRRKTVGLDIPITYIPNWAELESVEPRARSQNNLLRELNLTEKFVMLYAGNMGPPNDIESIIGAAEELSSNERFHFVFIGSGMKKPVLVQEVERRDLKNVTVLDPRPRKDQMDFLNACDISLVSLVDKMWGVSMPSRTYNILAAGKPIIAMTQTGSELARVVEEESVGWVVPPNEPRLLAQAILNASNRNGELWEMGLRARNAALSKYSVTTAITAYRSVID